MNNTNLLNYITTKGRTTMSELESEFKDSRTQLKEDLQILMQTHAIKMDEKGNIYKL